MSLSNQAMRDLEALVKLQTDGVVLQGYFEQGASSLKEDSVDGFYLLSELNDVSILSVSQHKGQVDSKVANILGNSSVKSSAGCQPRPHHPYDSGKGKKPTRDQSQHPEFSTGPGRIRN